MCGFVGIVGRVTRSEPERVGSALDQAAHAILHRGPDDAGVVVADGVGLAFRRLSILDLSQAGHQPMYSRCRRWLMVFNGEIYNHQTARARMEVPWRGHSDTETLVESLSIWGVEKTLEWVDGMFAFAAFDLQEGLLYLARDRFGEKPLYYGWKEGHLILGSQLSACWDLSARLGLGAGVTVDSGSVADLMTRRCVGGTRTIDKNFSKLAPSAWIAVSVADPSPSSVKYGVYYDRTRLLSQRREWRDESECRERFVEIFSQSVRHRMEADVPMGAFLSGGVDSSLVAAFMQKCSSRPVQTFTVGFGDSRFDESSAAREVANILGTSHHELSATEEDALGFVPRLPTIYDEPFADSSQIPTSLICQMIRRHVTVALSGDGGDEVFGGYNRHIMANGLLRRWMKCPTPLRRVAASLLRCRSLFVAAQAVRRGVVGASGGGRVMADKAEVISRAFGAPDKRGVYQQLLQVWPHADHVIQGGFEPIATAVPTDDLFDYFRWSDLTGYMPDDVLVKVDRASMASSLEVRSPFLAREVVEFGWSLPHESLVQNGVGKALLRTVLAGICGDAAHKPKQGFAAPLGGWLRGALKEWASEIVQQVSRSSQPWVDSRTVNRMWAEHVEGKRDMSDALWPVLVFFDWAQVRGVDVG